MSYNYDRPIIEKSIEIYEETDSESARILRHMLICCVREIDRLAQQRDTLKAEVEQMTAFRPGFTNLLKDLGFDERMLEEYRGLKMKARALTQQRGALKAALTAIVEEYEAWRENVVTVNDEESNAVAALYAEGRRVLGEVG